MRLSLLVPWLVAASACGERTAARPPSNSADAAQGTALDSGVGASSDAPPFVPPDAPSGGPACGLPSAAFCDTFSAASSAHGRAGELDPLSWSAGRLAPQGPTAFGQAFGIGPATLRPTRSADGGTMQLAPCRAGLAAQVLPDSDTIICDPSADIHSNHLLVAVAAQNYGENSYRIRQPFDFAARTGKIVFDAEGFNEGLLGWVSVDVTEDPIAVPSFSTLLNYEGGVLPKNGFDVQFNTQCSTDSDVSVSEIHVFNNYVDTAFTPPQGATPGCVKSAWGKLNHFEIDVSQQKIDVYGAPFSADGATFGSAVLLYSANVTLPFARGYVHITTHNHATLKYSVLSGTHGGFNALDAWIARWDNVAFDGPILRNWREYEVADSLVSRQLMPSNGPVTQGMDTGWTVADVSHGPSSTLHFSGVDLTGAMSAQIALTAWYCSGCGQPIAPFALKYRLNRNTWHDRPLTAGELTIATGNKSQGALGQMLDVPIGELIAGDNTFEIVSANVPQNYPPGVVNVDLVLQTQ